jgi:hypothetical protein
MKAATSPPKVSNCTSSGASSAAITTAASCTPQRGSQGWRQAPARVKATSSMTETNSVSPTSSMKGLWV